MKCPNCGNENPPDYLFCDECGARLIGNDVAAASDDDSIDAQPQSASAGGSGGLGAYNMDSSQTSASSPAAGYEDYSMGGSQADQQSSQNSSDDSGMGGYAATQTAEAPSDPWANSTDMSATPAADDSANNGWAGPSATSDYSTPVQSAPSYVGDDSGSDNTDDSAAYQDAMSSVSGVAEDARQAVDDSMTAAPTPTPDWAVNVGATPDLGGSSAADTASSSDDTSLAPAGNDWAAHALSVLNQAQSALSDGDWHAFGKGMNDLKAALQSAAGGAVGSLAHPQMSGPAASVQEPEASAGTSADDTSSSSTDTSTSSADMPGTFGGDISGTEPATPFTSAPAETYEQTYEPVVAPAVPSVPVAPVAQVAPTLDGAPVEDTSMAQASDMSASQAPSYPSYTSADNSAQASGSSNGLDVMGSAPAPTQPATLPPAVQPIPVSPISSTPTPVSGGTTNGARLILISSGAEMSLPDQEEITVGREDPSSGIFPDVDLTPHGGEDGGVSRRHARLLHIGDDYFVEDLQSTNFTKLDGQRLPAHVRERLDDGARLDFGRVAMIFRRG